MSIDYTTWYQNAQAELQRVRGEKAELELAVAAHDQQIAALIQTMNAIAPLIGEEAVDLPAREEAPPAGMTDCIRNILAKAGEPLSASEVRDRLQEIGFDMQSYSNPLATVHTILRRLTESQELETYYEADAPGAKRFAVVGKGIAVEKVAGKDFAIGKFKGFIGVGKLKRVGKTAKQAK